MRREGIVSSRAIAAMALLDAARMSFAMTENLPKKAEGVTNAEPLPVEPMTRQQRRHKDRQAAKRVPKKWRNK